MVDSMLFEFASALVARWALLLSEGKATEALVLTYPQAKVCLTVSLHNLDEDLNEHQDLDSAP
jgi:hypothetical protein